MRISRIYYANKLKTDTKVSLNPQAANHILHVLRLKPGAELILFNGTGGEYEAELTAITKQQAVAKIKKFNDKNIESPLKIHLAQGISRGEKMDYTIQKAVELGVHKITPIFTERCNVKLDQERLQRKLQHWQKIAISACEQCGRNYIPTIASSQTIDHFLSQDHSGQCIVLNHRADKKIKNLPQTNSCTILIGPEGGLTSAEITNAENKNFISIKLGPRILRTETAALAAITALQTKWGDL